MGWLAGELRAPTLGQKELNGVGPLADLDLGVMYMCRQPHVQRQSPTCQMIFDVIGDLLADGRQFKHLVLDDRIISLFGKFPIHHRLIS